MVRLMGVWDVVALSENLTKLGEVPDFKQGKGAGGALVHRCQQFRAVRRMPRALRARARAHMHRACLSRSLASMRSSARGLAPRAHRQVLNVWTGKGTANVQGKDEGAFLAAWAEAQRAPRPAATALRAKTEQAGAPPGRRVKPGPQEATAQLQHGEADVVVEKEVTRADRAREARQRAVDVEASGGGDAAAGGAVRSGVLQGSATAAGPRGPVRLPCPAAGEGEGAAPAASLPWARQGASSRDDASRRALLGFRFDDTQLKVIEHAKEGPSAT